MKMRLIILAVILAFTVICGGAHADGLKLPSIISDNMVIQQGIPAPIWGWADPGADVKVTISGKSSTATADKVTGKWMLKLKPLKSGGPLEMTVSSKSETRTIKNILVGEVWLCSGQSNMFFKLQNAINGKEEIAKANYPQMRQFEVARITCCKPQEDCPGQWVVCSPATAAKFTAVGYFFGLNLHKTLETPVGLISSSVGGTPIEAWSSKATMDSEQEFNAAIAKLDKAIAAPEAPLTPRPIALGRDALPTSLYNAMIAPLMPYGIKGAIWYQGEANASDKPNSYFYKLRGMITGWRKAWGQGDFPFYFVQLANRWTATTDPAGNDGMHWATLRQSQLQALSVKNTGMAVAIDLADPENPKDVHPKDKQDVGYRLALWALAKNYGKKDLVFSGPIYKKMKIEGNKIRISFDYIGGGLVVGAKSGVAPFVEVKDQKLKNFAIAGADKKWHWADAAIDGDTVIVSCPDVPNPVAVRYAYSMNPVGNKLYNKAGLPASPFRTDTW